jgi:hypothetical protein
MSPLISPPKSVLLLVGREEYTPPRSFGGNPCAATHDCLAVGVRNEGDGPTEVTLAPTADTSALVSLGEYSIESEGLLSLRDVFNREYDAMGVDAGTARVTVWADDDSEPSEIVFEVRPG